MSTLNISIENDQIISRFNGKGKGSIVCPYINEDQVNKIISNHNKRESINPTAGNPQAIRVKDKDCTRIKLNGAIGGFQ